MEHQANLEKSYLALIEFLLLSKKELIKIGEKNHITSIQALTLILLSESRPMKSFTKVFHCDPSNTTGIIDGLERKQLVSRFESPTDRRVKMIKLESRGEKLRKNIIDSIIGQDSFILKKLDSKEMTTFIKLLEKITDRS